MRPSLGPESPPKGLMRPPLLLMQNEAILLRIPLPASLPLPGECSPQAFLLRTSRYLMRPFQGRLRPKRGAEPPFRGTQQSPEVSHHPMAPPSPPKGAANRPKGISQHPKEGLMRNHRGR